MPQRFPRRQRERVHETKEATGCCSLTTFASLEVMPAKCLQAGLEGDGTAALWSGPWSGNAMALTELLPHVNQILVRIDLISHAIEPHLTSSSRYCNTRKTYLTLLLV